MKRNGQALVEFIIILPVLVFILLAIIDFGIIFSKNNSLENKANQVVNNFEKSVSFELLEQKLKEDNKNIKLSITNEENKYVNITITEEYKTMTPGLNLILGSPYLIEVKRVIYYE